MGCEHISLRWVRERTGLHGPREDRVDVMPATDLGDSPRLAQELKGARDERRTTGATEHGQVEDARGLEREGKRPCCVLLCGDKDYPLETPRFPEDLKVGEDDRLRQPLR
jgi:hypothetical protein